MVSPTGLRLISKFLTLGLLITCTVILTRGVDLARYVRAGGRQATSSRVSVKPQPDAPLRLNVLSDNTSNPNDRSVTVEVTNAGTKAVRAYSISQEMMKGNEKSNWLLFSDTGVLSEGLQAGQYSTDELSCSSSWDEDSRMSLAVDLVEFADGATWGPDAEKSSEILAGRRAGEREAGKRLLKLYKEKGIQETIKSLEDRSLEVRAPDGYSPEWKEGFQNGQGGMARRLKGAKGRGGTKQVEEELRKISEKFGWGK
jgi:hypothetical protein